MTLRRLLIWSIALLGLLTAVLWWVGRQPAPVSPAAQVPAVVMPPSSSPVEGGGASTDVDALWRRYEALSEAAATASASAPVEGEQGGMSSSAETRSPEQMLSEAAQQRQALREGIRQRSEAVRAARDDALAQIRDLEPDDIDGLMDVIQGFNQQMRENGVEEQIDIGGMRQQLVSSQRLAEVSQAMLDEALKGENANPQRLQELSREMSALQQEVIDLHAMRSSGGQEQP